CNFDKKPGYAGVENPLYDMPNATLMLGDAGETLKELLGILNGSGAKQAASTPSQGSAQDDSFIKEAKKVIIVPGYGMALAQAQQLVKQVADKYEDLGAVVDYAIHPVAGRMPGHMNVLLAEADVPYEKLREMDDINPEFSGCDLAIVIGANDVVNPAANTAEGTPIYGMPVLDVEKAKHIIICNFDKKPGYAGVENPLYDMPNATLMLGDAGETLKELLGILNGSGAKQAVSASSQISAQDDSFIKEAKKVIIVPGYGMALAQAQQLVKQVADKYEDLGAVVDYAIHPVAGRMPGHMNVLLAEADVPYEKLREMEDINPEFDGCDLAIVIGANDVVNPAANTAEGTPIYGMPVLDVEKAKHIIICNFDKKPGYAGVDNPLYDMPNATLMLGDAGETLKKLLGKLQ
ncbi:NAD(P)(+) transhydrogenase (Re/Si-specific) subunit beta, partial [Tyzzerella sp. OttesenSCG-928-J15]|nr:NAD(P)(+) transhydrogenase (Re/Si-specific) subunit beta [Tyzzerella sp. OttesenSCG-928-J15]